MFKVCVRQIKWLFLNPKFYIAILLGTLGCTFNAVRLIQFSEYLQQPLNIFEAFIYSASDRFAMTICLLSILFLFSDIPFGSGDEVYILIRISKKKWIFSKTIQVLLTCVLYYIIVVFIGMLVILPNAFIANIWSDPIYTMSFTNMELALDLFKLYLNGAKMLLALQPVQAFCISFSLTVLYSFSMCILLLFLNMKMKKSVGLAIVILVHSIGYVIHTSFIEFSEFSLFSNSLLTEHNFNNKYDISGYPTVIQSYSIYFVLIAIFIIIAIAFTKKYEFRNTMEIKQ